MASNAVSGVGTKFLRWSGSAWVVLSEITSITGPTMTRDFIDVTSLDSTGGYREFITGFRDAGTISLSMNFTRDTYDAFKADFESAAAKYYEIVLSDVENTTLEFEGLVTECPITIPTDDKITSDVTIKISGVVTVNSGSFTETPSAGWEGDAH
jgi:predicted secreted protein